MPRSQRLGRRLRPWPRSDLDYEHPGIHYWYEETNDNLKYNRDYEESGVVGRDVGGFPSGQSS